jgi:predicted transcriptional regulator
VPCRLSPAELRSRRGDIIGEDDTLAAAAHKMTCGKCRHLPVVRDGELVGLLSERDILACRGNGHQLDDLPTSFALPW